MWQEKRKNKRITLSLPIDYEILNTEEKEINSTICKNISEGGLKLVFKKFYLPKAQFLVKINLAGINRVVETIAESAWSFNMHFSNMYYTGVRFLDLSISNRRNIREYLMMKEITNPSNN
ncbi:PilZ domain-containing protein [Candidatus Omnitrophota bacterium]